MIGHVEPQFTSHRSDKDYHLTLFGATSYVGRIVCEHLIEEFGCLGDLTWAVAGRSESRLTELWRELGEPEGLRQIVADAAVPESLKAMCSQTRVVASTVGPYALYGDELVRICAETGTDYCDLTGEIQWVARMLGRHEETAKKSGARIVHCCGFDSIPSDLGVYLVQSQARKIGGTPCSSVSMRVMKTKGSASGGSIASIMNIFEEAITDRATRKSLADPYSLCGQDHGLVARQPGLFRMGYDRNIQSWITPFLMTAVNTRIVHRSNALQNRIYGREFRYDEASATGRGLGGFARAVGLIVGFAAVAALGAIGPLRRFLARRIVRQPGEGPGEAEREAGCFELIFVGNAKDGQRVQVEVTGDRDPGYGSTARMFGEAAASLATDQTIREAGGGFWTPAALFGDDLIRRLSDRAGVTFTLRGNDRPTKR